VVVLVAAKDSGAANVVVPEVLLIINDTNVVLLLLVMVPVPNMVRVMVVYVPVADNVKSPAMFSAVVPGLNEVVPKFRLSNQPAVVNVATDAPVVNVKFTAFAVDPPVVPNVNVRVLAMFATVKPPGPVYENPVTMAILNTTVAAVVCVRLILPALVLPNATDRVLTLVELNIPVANVTPSANVNVPAVKV
jgi:hypothetical protein